MHEKTGRYIASKFSLKLKAQTQVTRYSMVKYKAGDEGADHRKAQNENSRY